MLLQTCIYDSNLNIISCSSGSAMIMAGCTFRGYEDYNYEGDIDYLYGPDIEGDVQVTIFLLCKLQKNINLLIFITYLINKLITGFWRFWQTR